MAEYEDYLKNAGQMETPAYDMRGWWEANGQPTSHPTGEHWGDRYKTEQHPTYSTQSVVPGGRTGGTWVNDQFTPADWQSPERSARYIADSRLHTNDQTSQMAIQTMLKLLMSPR